MGQVLNKEKIGALSESGGTITLAPSVLTIGGQQYSTGTLDVVADTTNASTWYRVYAVVSAGSVSLVTSVNNNSVGPIGSNVWKLVGHYFSSRLNNPVNVNAATIDGFVNRKPFSAQIFRNSTGGSSMDTVYATAEFNEAFGDDFNMADVGNFQILIPIDSKYRFTYNVSSSAFSATSDALDTRLIVGPSVRAGNRSGAEVSNPINHGGREYPASAGQAIYIEAKSITDDPWQVAGDGNSANSYLIVEEILPQGLIRDEDL